MNLVVSFDNCMVLKSNQSKHSNLVLVLFTLSFINFSFSLTFYYKNNRDIHFFHSFLDTMLSFEYYSNFVTILLAWSWTVYEEQRYMITSGALKQCGQLTSTLGQLVYFILFCIILLTNFMRIRQTRACIKAQVT